MGGAFSAATREKAILAPLKGIGSTCGGMLVFAAFLLVLLLIAPFSTSALPTLPNSVTCRDHSAGRRGTTPCSKFNGSKNGLFGTRPLEPLVHIRARKGSLSDGDEENAGCALCSISRGDGVRLRPWCCCTGAGACSRSCRPYGAPHGWPAREGRVWETWQGRNTEHQAGKEQALDGTQGRSGPVRCSQI